MSIIVHYLTVISVAYPAIAAIFMFRRAHKSFLPFFIVLWLGLANELLSQVMIAEFRSNAVNGNIYVYLEGLLVLWQFKKWGRLNDRIINFPVLGMLFTMIWVADNFFISSITVINSIYRSFYSFVIVFLSLHQMNMVIVRERKNILKNSIFLICAAFVIYYSYKAFIEIIYLLNELMSKSFTNYLYRIMNAIDVVCNLIYTIAILWIPKRLRFTLPY